MWHDRLPAARRRRLVERLHRVLPAPAPAARGAVTPLRLRRGNPPRPEQVAEVLRHRPGFSWLDGGAAGHLLFAEPLAVLTARNGRSRVTGPGGLCRLTAGGFALLEAAFAAWGGPAHAALVGFLGYELGAEIEALDPSPSTRLDDLHLPDLHLALYPTALRWDGRDWTLESSSAWHGHDPVRAAEAVLTAARSLPFPEPPPAGRLAVGPVTSRPDRSGFEAAVRRATERIGTGEIFQVNLCRRIESALPASLLPGLYRRLRAASPADHGAFLDLGRGRALLSVSPELFLCVHGREVETRPIKGTRPRGAGARADQALARELLESVKDRAELTMIVDVARNDLGRVCVPGSVTVPRHAELITLPTLHHTVSTVRGRLAESA
ncbi:MAG TPA: hypothetical protein DD490_26640, partial [Acidobacteria bacterium]|nr:hypothetical protein [Acidobacteriota bacterium]